VGEAYYIIKLIVKRVPGYRDIVLPMVFKVKRPYEELRVRSDEGLFAKYSHVLLAWVFERDVWTRGIWKGSTRRRSSGR